MYAECPLIVVVLRVYITIRHHHESVSSYKKKSHYWISVHTTMWLNNLNIFIMKSSLESSSIIEIRSHVCRYQLFLSNGSFRLVMFGERIWTFLSVADNTSIVKQYWTNIGMRVEKKKFGIHNWILCDCVILNSSKIISGSLFMQMTRSQKRKKGWQRGGRRPLDMSLQRQNGERSQRLKRLSKTFINRYFC